MDRVQAIATVINAVRACVSQSGARTALDWVYSTDAFDAPAQGVVFQLTTPDVAFVFFTHLEDRPEFECRYEGPIPFAEALERLPEIFEKFSQVDLALGDVRGHKTLAGVMESTFSSFFAEMGSTLLQVGIGALVPSLSKVVATLIVPGAFDAQDVDLLANSVKTQLNPARVQSSGRQSYFREGKSEREIHWARFVPATWIGDTVPINFEQKVRAHWQGDYPRDLTGPVWRTACGTTPLLVFTSGVVAADNTNELECLRALNTFFAACNFAGQSCTPTTQYELGYMSVLPTGHIGSYGGPAEVGRAVSTGGGVFPVNKLERAMKIIAQASRDADLALRLRLGHASKTHFLAGEHLQSFSLAWTVVEKSLTKMWEDFLTSKQIGGRRLEQLTQGDQFTAFVIIEGLNLCGQLPAERHGRLQRLRKLRNDVMHKGREPSFQEVGDCILEMNTFLASTIDPA